MPSTSLPASERRKRLASLENVADKLDTRFSVLGFRFGWDSILGLIPGVGDAVTAVPGAYMIYQGSRMGAPRSTLIRMGLNTGADFVIGGIPVVGDIFDAFFKANRRNVALLRTHVEQMEAAEAALDDEDTRVVETSGERSEFRVIEGNKKEKERA